MIEPTIGQSLLYFPKQNEGNQFDSATPFAARVVFVHKPYLVNAVVDDHAGVRKAVYKVTLLQDGVVPEVGEAYLTFPSTKTLGLPKK